MPYLSVVVAARNDDYGGDFLGRMSRFLNGLFLIGVEVGLDAELIVVEWNPPKERPLLAEAIDWDSFPHRLTTRIVAVDRGIHETFGNADVMPIHEYIAKNTGVRRARGTFVLSTNPDLAYPRSLLRFLAKQRLRENAFYRVDRFDVRSAPPDEGPDRQLRYLARNVWRANIRGRSVVFDDPPGRVARLRLLAQRRQINGVEPTDRLHTNAAGDFLLMHASHWNALHGYPEITTSGHSDGFLCIAAAASGLREVILREPVYHQEHVRAVDWTDLSTATRPVTDFGEFEGAAREMLSSRRPQVVNGEGWGLGDRDLPETVIAAA